jgi:hypothetical protein
LLTFTCVIHSLILFFGILSCGKLPTRGHAICPPNSYPPSFAALKASSYSAPPDMDGFER